MSKSHPQQLPAGIEEPQSSAFSARIFSDGRMVFDGKHRRNTFRQSEPSERYTFRFPDEMKKVPAQIIAEEYLLTDDEGREFSY